jgi:hypothetical protein
VWTILPLCLESSQRRPEDRISGALPPPRVHSSTVYGTAGIPSGLRTPTHNPSTMPQFLLDLPPNRWYNAPRTDAPLGGRDSRKALGADASVRIPMTPGAIQGRQDQDAHALGVTNRLNRDGMPVHTRAVPLYGEALDHRNFLFLDHRNFLFLT